MIMDQNLHQPERNISIGSSVSVTKSLWIWEMDISWIYPPPRIPVANEGLGWDSLRKMVHNPGGDWHPGWGVDQRHTLHTLTISDNLLE